MTISRHLKLTLFALLGTVFTVGLLGIWVRDRIHSSAYSGLEHRMGLMLLLEEIEDGVLSIQSAEKSFLLRYPIDGVEHSSQYVDVAFGTVEKVRGDLDRIAEVGQPEEGDRRQVFQDQIEANLVLLELHLGRVVKLAEQKGDSRSGMVWEMHRMADGLERFLEQLAGSGGGAARQRTVMELRQDLLHIRRWEKDYFVREDMGSISTARAGVMKAQQRLENNSLSPKERGRVTTYLNTYLIYFERIALNDVQMLEERNRINLAAEQLTGLVEEYLAFEQKSIAMEEAEMQERQGQSTGMLIVLFLAIYGGAVGLAFTLTRRITGRLDTLVEAAGHIGEKGECPTIEMDTEDEFARLAEAFNQMVKQLNETQQRLIQSEKLSATGKLSASIAHEINNPLFGIQGCLERVAKRLPKNDSDRRLVDLAIRESQRIARLVQGMRDYHRPSDQTMGPVDLLKLLDDTFLLNDKYIQHAGVTLERDLPASLPQVSGTRDQLQMVFVNLITNAVEAMGEGGTLSVSARQENGKVRLTFRDTGKGIEPEVVQRIFEPFFSTKNEVKGVGLGLSISYGIVKRHKGEINVVSTPGDTCFNVTLPVLKEARETGKRRKREKEAA